MQDKEKKEFTHYTVMKKEVVDSINCENSDKIFVDCTLGGGGHSEEILKRISKKGRLIAFDVDDDAIEFASERLKKYENLGLVNYNKNKIKSIIIQMMIMKQFQQLKEIKNVQQNQIFIKNK